MQANDLQSHGLLGGLIARVGHVVKLEPGEVRPVVWSFLYFSALLTAYYVVRPVRDELGVVIGPDALKTVFVYVLVVMLTAVPVFGWVVTTFDRRWVVPIAYVFFAANLAVYWLLLRHGTESKFVAMSFFVWVSVFNLFVISLFWSVMSSVWTAGQAKRLYGLIAAGGTAGAMAGPLITQTFVHVLGRPNMLLVSAGFLLLALVAALRLSTGFHAAVSPSGAAQPEKGPATLSAVLEGATQVWRSPYLFRIAVWVLLANLISTYFYFEQARILGGAIADRNERVQLLARVDLAVSILTVLLQLTVTARFIERFGLAPAAAALPLSACVAFVALAAVPSLATIILIIVVERTVHFSLTNPAARVLYTVVEPEEKFKAQNFVDTVVFRAGDAASGVYFDALAKMLGLGVTGVAFVTLPLAAAWVWLSFGLVRAFEAKGGATPGHEKVQ